MKNNKKNLEPRNDFKAVYNPFTKELSVVYGEVKTEHTFKDIEEWTKVSFGGDDNHPNYLHIQLDYDETCQLIFYPRVDDNESLHESLSTSFNSGYMNEIPNKIKIVYNDEEYKQEVKKITFEPRGLLL